MLTAKEVLSKISQELTDPKDLALSMASFIQSKTMIHHEMRDIFLSIYKDGGLYVEGTNQINEEVFPKDYWYMPVPVQPVKIGSLIKEEGFDIMIVTGLEFARAIDGKLNADSADLTEIEFLSGDYVESLDSLARNLDPTYALFQTGDKSEVEFSLPFTVDIEYFGRFNANEKIIIRPKDLAELAKFRTAKVTRDVSSIPKMSISIVQTLSLLSDEVNTNVTNYTILQMLGQKEGNLTIADVKSAVEMKLGNSFELNNVNTDQLLQVATDNSIDLNDKVSYVIESLVSSASEIDEIESVGMYSDDEYQQTFLSSLYTGKDASSFWTASACSNALGSAFNITLGVMKMAIKCVITLIKSAFGGIKRLWKKYIQPAYKSKDFVKSDCQTRESHVDVPMIHVGTIDQGMVFDMQGLSSSVAASLAKQKVTNIQYNEVRKHEYVNNNLLVNVETPDQFSSVIETEVLINDPVIHSSQLEVTPHYSIHRGLTTMIKPEGYDSIEYRLALKDQTTWKFGVQVAEAIDVVEYSKYTPHLIYTGNKGCRLIVGSEQISAGVYNTTISLGDWYDGRDNWSRFFVTLFSMKNSALKSYTISDYYDDTDILQRQQWLIPWPEDNSDESYEPHVKIITLYFANGDVCKLLLRLSRRFDEVALTAQSFERDLISWLVKDSEFRKVTPAQSHVVCNLVLEDASDNKNVQLYIQPDGLSCRCIFKDGSETVVYLNEGEDDGIIELVTSQPEVNNTHEVVHVVEDNTTSLVQIFFTSYPYLVKENHVCVLDNSLYTTLQYRYIHGLGILGDVQRVFSTPQFYQSSNKLRSRWISIGECEVYSVPVQELSTDTVANLIQELNNPVKIGCALVTRFKFGSLQIVRGSDDQMRFNVYVNPIDHKAFITDDGYFRWTSPDGISMVYDGQHEFTTLEAISNILSSVQPSNEAYSYEEGDLLAYKDLYASLYFMDFFIWLLLHPDNNVSEYFVKGSFHYMRNKVWIKSGQVNNKSFVQLLYGDDNSLTLTSDDTISLIYAWMTNIMMTKPQFMRVHYLLYGVFPSFFPYVEGDRLGSALWHVQSDSDIQKYVENVLSAVVIAALVVAAITVVGITTLKVKKALRKRLIANKQTEWNDFTHGNNLYQTKQAKAKEKADILKKLDADNLSAADKESLNDKLRDLDKDLLALDVEIDANTALMVKHQRANARWEKLASVFGIKTSTEEKANTAASSEADQYDAESLKSELSTVKKDAQSAYDGMRDMLSQYGEDNINADSHLKESFDALSLVFDQAISKLSDIERRVNVSYEVSWSR